MTDIFLFTGEANPADIKLRDPTTLGGGGTVWTYTGSGGIVFAGSAATLKIKVYSVSGGLTFAGTAVLNKLKVFQPAGGLTFAGSAPVSKDKVFLTSGGVVFGGAAATQFAVVHIYQPSGGITLAGTALHALLKAFLPSGGVVLGGSAGLSKDKAFLPSGQATFGGAAATSYVPGAGAPQTYTYVGSGGLTFAGKAGTIGPAPTGQPGLVKFVRMQAVDVEILETESGVYHLSGRAEVTALDRTPKVVFIGVEVPTTPYEGYYSYRQSAVEAGCCACPDYVIGRYSKRQRAEISGSAFVQCGPQYQSSEVVSQCRVSAGSSVSIEEVGSRYATSDPCKVTGIHNPTKEQIAAVVAAIHARNRKWPTKKRMTPARSSTSR